MIVKGIGKGNNLNLFWKKYVKIFQKKKEKIYISIHLEIREITTLFPKKVPFPGFSLNF